MHEIRLRIYFKCLMQLSIEMLAIELNSFHRDSALALNEPDQNAKHEISHSFGLIRLRNIAQECLGTFWDPGNRVRERYF